MALLPPKSRCTLDWQMFKELDSGDHLLVLPPFYAELFEAHFPELMTKSKYGFDDTQRGNNKRAFFRAFTDRDVEKVESFIAYWRRTQRLLER